MAVNEQAIAIAANQFVATRPDFAEYNVPVNIEAMATEIISTWGEAGLENASCWEIVFLEMHDRLTKNDDHLSEANKRRLDNMSTAQIREAMRTEPNFPDLWNRYSRATVPLESTTNDPYISLDAAGYAAILPVERARLYAHDLMFRRATERLIQEGVI